MRVCFLKNKKNDYYCVLKVLGLNKLIMDYSFDDDNIKTIRVLNKI